MFGTVSRRSTYLIAAAVLLLAATGTIIAAQAESGFLTPADTAGSLIVLRMSGQGADEESIRSFFASQGFERAVVQRLGPADAHTFQIRTAAALPEDAEGWLSALERELGAVDREALEIHTAETAAPDFAEAGLQALIVVVAVTVIAVWWFVRSLPGALLYPAATLAMLLLSVALAFGFHALMTLVAGWSDVTSLAVALPAVAALALQAAFTVLGRVRSNSAGYHGESRNRVLIRSTAESTHAVLVTTACTAIVPTALLASPAHAVAPLAATVLFGAVGAAYSSLFVLIPLLAVPQPVARATRRSAPATQRGKKRGRRAAKASRWRLWMWIPLALAAVGLIWILLPKSKMPSDPAERDAMYSQPPETTINSSSRYIATFVTEKGEFVAELYADKAPNTVNNFVFLAREGFYDGTTFHRVMPDFMAQGGDPTGTGAGGPGYVIEDEFHPDLKHDQAGVLSMANRGLPNTGSSQFFVTYGATPWLDPYDDTGQPKDCSDPQVACHAVFGQVIEGFDVVLSLTPRDPEQDPQQDGDLILSIRIEEQ
jgi:cyclophilin family peptidyl-prolyl cis-trans isomerase/preprotein translocase subunit SecF